MIKIAETAAEIENCFLCFQALRPHMTCAKEFVAQVLRQMKAGYQIAYIHGEDGAFACIGYRPMETLAWGRVLYIDDLITLPESRGKGFAKLLLEYVKNLAKESGCEQVHLDSGYTRHGAHKTYLKCGFSLNSHHFSCALKVGVS